MSLEINILLKSRFFSFFFEKKWWSIRKRVYICGMIRSFNRNSVLGYQYYSSFWKFHVLSFF
ncbi:MAG: hypothetical protein RL757_1894 [Bacteroidota bacterium]|jgi:hypothetical protein